jgi:hypothetical protein
MVHWWGAGSMWHPYAVFARMEWLLCFSTERAFHFSKCPTNNEGKNMLSKEPFNYTHK